MIGDNDETSGRAALDVTAPAQPAAAATIWAQVERAAFPLSIAKYKVVKRLGAGQMGVVLEALQESPQRKVALKIVRADNLSDDGLSTFVTETAALGRFNHQGIAQIYDAGRYPVPHIVMEFVEGVTLDVWLKEARPTISERLDVVTNVVEAVAYAHRRGVLHLDLKPKNIMMSAGGPKIIDFGIARLLGADTVVDAVSANAFVGTPRYMSPEQTRAGELPVDERSDIYTLGFIAYEVLTERSPYPLGDNLLKNLQTIQHVQPQKLADTWKEPDGSLDAVLRMALQKKPERRYQSATALAEDLRKAAQGDAIDDAARTANWPTRVSLWAGRKDRLKQVGGVGGWISAGLSLFNGAYALMGLAMSAGWVEHEPELRPLDFASVLGFWALLLGLMSLTSWKASEGRRWAVACGLAAAVGGSVFMVAALFGFVSYDVGGALTDPETRELLLSLHVLLGLLGVLLFGAAWIAVTRRARLDRQTRFEVRA